MKFKIADNSSLPVEAVTQTFATLAVRGSGKSYLSSVLAEEMLKAGQQIIAFDPTGGWWGLRSSADGKSAGHPVVVFGGEHADVPLEETAGEVIATSIIQGRYPAVIDVSLLRKGATQRFAVSFFETLYRLNREPVHLFVDEADSLAPQSNRYGGEENRLLGAMEDIVRRGRKRGIGCSLITQRPAVLNKNVLTQCESLFVLRMGHPRDIAAIKEWVDVHAAFEESKTVISSLPTMKVGEAWLWSPAWLGVLKRMQIRKRETFDSSATPKPGQVIRQPKKRAEIDLKQLGAQIAQTIERAKASDPRELQKQVLRLQRELTISHNEVEMVKGLAAKKIASKPVEIPVLSEKVAKQLTASVDKLERVLGAVMTGLRESVEDVKRGMAQFKSPQFAPPTKATAVQEVKRLVAPTLARTDLAKPKVDNLPVDLTGPEQRILDAIAWLESIRVENPEQGAVAFLAGYTVGGGAFNNPRGRLNTRGFVKAAGGRISLTEAGRAAANTPDAPLTTEELQRRILERLPTPEQRILKPLLKAYPNSISTDELANLAQYAPKAGAFNNPKGRLRTLGLIDYPQAGYCVAKPLLFLGS